jgi:hypothetical protein
MITLPAGWDSGRDKELCDRVLTGQRISHEHGWDDCNLWVIMDHELKAWRQDERPQQRFINMMLNAVREQSVKDTREDPGLHCLVAWALDEWEQIDARAAGSK